MDVEAENRWTAAAEDDCGDVEADAEAVERMRPDVGTEAV